MAYEIFTRKVQRMGNPVLTFSKIGQIAFNQHASRILQKEPVENILLMWDPTERKLAIKATSNKKDPRAYHLRYNDKGNGASFSAKTFMDYIGMDYSERKSVPIDIDTNHELLVEVKLPDSFFKKPQPRIILEKGKVG